MTWKCLYTETQSKDIRFWVLQNYFTIKIMVNNYVLKTYSFLFQSSWPRSKTWIKLTAKYTEFIKKRGYDQRNGIDMEALFLKCAKKTW